MAMRTAISLLILVVTLGCVASQTTYPVINITKGETLPTLQALQPDASGWITLSMLPATIQVLVTPESLAEVAPAAL